MYVEIEKPIDILSRVIWRFWFYETSGTLVLDGYSIQKRKTSRSKFEVEKQYSRLDHQRNPMKWIKLEDVPLTDEIKKDALDKFMSTIKVDVWKDRF